MTLIRKNIPFARITDAAFFDEDGYPGLDASDLDFYMFDREARMDEVWDLRVALQSGESGKSIFPQTPERDTTSFD